eukprot:scaffold11127_cov55-Phaeocystis_antarctica.AAC.2
MTGGLREAICVILIAGSCVCKALHRACKALRRGVFTELSAELNIVRLVNIHVSKEQIKICASRTGEPGPRAPRLTAQRLASAAASICSSSDHSRAVLSRIVWRACHAGRSVSRRYSFSGSWLGLGLGLGLDPSQVLVVGVLRGRRDAACMVGASRQWRGV